MHVNDKRSAGPASDPKENEFFDVIKVIVGIELNLASLSP